MATRDLKLHLQRRHGEEPVGRRMALSSVRLVCVAFVLALSASGVLPVSAAQTSSDDERTRYAYFVESLPGSDVEAALTAYNEFMADNGSVTAENAKDLLVKMYAAAGDPEKAHKTVALIIKQELGPENTSADFNRKFADGDYQYRQISKEHSITLAKARDALIEQTVMKVLEEHKSDGWYVGRSDSGNVDSGMKSDIDQTFYAYRIEDGKRVRSEALDAAFIEAFEQTWNAQEATRDVSLDALDVVSIEGSNNFPDPRSLSLDEYGKAFEGTIANLRNTEGAYSTYGAQQQQVQQRIWDVLDDVDGQTGEVGNQRIFQTYGPDGESFDGEIVKHGGFDVELAMETMFFAKPEIMEGHAFGAAIANFMFLQEGLKKGKFDPKYHLRTFDDAMFTRQLMEMGQGKRWKQDLLDMNRGKQDVFLEKVLDDLFAEGQKKRHHRLALEISMDQRRIHKGKVDDVSAFRDRAGAMDASPEMQKQWLYEGLAKELHGSRFDPENNPRWLTEQQIKGAELYHKQLANEFCLQSVYKTGKENFDFIKDGSVADRCRHLYGAMSDAQWNKMKLNMQKGAKLTLLYSIYDLGMLRSIELVRQLDAPAGTKFRTWLHGQFQPIMGAYDNPDPYMRNVKARLGELSTRAQMHALTELGFSRVPEAEAAHVILKNQRLNWSMHGLAKSMFWNPGSIDAIGQIMLSYSQSRGDFEVVAAKVLDELYLALPLVGQAEGVRRGGGVGLVLMAWGMYHPAVGGVMLAYSFGNTCYTLYQVEVGQPYRGNLEDILYRGFAGPETVAYGEFGKAPPQWNNSDQQKLDALKKELQLARPPIVMTGDPTMVAAMEPTPEERQRQIERYNAARKRLEPQIHMLEMKKAAFEQYSSGAWLGGYITGYGHVPEQLWIDDYLLKEVVPTYGFFTKGVVDLTLEFDEKTQGARIATIEEDIDKARTSDELLELSAEHHELTLLRDRYERAQRYKKHMEQKDRREMVRRFKRDSLARWVVDNQKNIDNYVDNWFAEKDKDGVMREERIAKQLHAMGLLSNPYWHPESMPPGIGPSSNPALSRYEEDIPMTIIPTDVKDNLKKRMLADFKRSQMLMNTYRKQELARADKSKENMKKAKPLFEAESAGLFIEEMIKDPNFRDSLTALRYAAIPRLRPKIEATIYKTQKDPKQFRQAGDDISEAFELGFLVNVKTDPTLYFEPYSSKMIVLDKDSLGSLGGEVQGVQIDSETAGVIAAIQSEHAQEIADGNGVVAVLSFYASGMADMTGALKETFAGLPGIEMAGQDGQVLMGQQATFVPVRRKSVKVEPVKVKVLDQAGKPLGNYENCECTVTIAGEKALPTVDEFWKAYEFTKYDETIDIVATYTLADGSTLTGNAQLSVNDVNDWGEPQPLAEPITITLPVFGPGSFDVKGVVEAKAGPNEPIPAYVAVKNEALGINETAIIPGGDKSLTSTGSMNLGGGLIGEAIGAMLPGGRERPEDGSFMADVEAPIKVGAPIKLTFLGGTTKNKFQAVKTMPATSPGMIDFGKITLTPVRDEVVIPRWDPTNPPTAQAYLQQLTGAGLSGTVKLGDLPDKGTLQHRVQETDPGAGRTVARGTEVTVTIYGEFARAVPSVIGMNAQDANETLTDAGFTATFSLGDPATKKTDEFKVAAQSAKPNEKHSPDIPIACTLHGQFVPTIVVPDLEDMPLREAKKAVEEEAKLHFEVADDAKEADAADKRGRVYKQEPQAKAKVGADAKVKVWAYAGGASVPVASGPYYVAFQLTMPAPKEGPLPKFAKGENESTEAYRERKYRAIMSLSESQIQYKASSPEDNVVVLHISGEALRKYPAGFFTDGENYTCKMSGKGTTGSGDPMTLDGALLLTALSRHDSLEEIVAAYPAFEKKKEKNSLSFTSAAGTAVYRQEDSSFLVGPLTKGWTSADKRDALKVFATVLASLDCYIATAVYPEPMSHAVTVLRQFRDDILLRSQSGRHLAELYYLYGPRVAMALLDRPAHSAFVRWGLDTFVAVLETVDAANPLVKVGFDLMMHKIDKTARPFFGPADSVVEEYQKAWLRQRFDRIASNGSSQN